MLALVITLSMFSGGLASILCPTVFNPNQTIHLPHPTSCSKFLTCVGSHPVEQDCPAGLHWNVEQSGCDYPGTPRCSRVSDSDQSFNATSVASSVCLPQNNQCPLNSKPSDHVIFLKHHDCRKFYACVSTHPVELSCPPKLYWNSKSCVCDYEMEAECNGIFERIEEDAPKDADEEQDSQQEEESPIDVEEEEESPVDVEQEEHPIQEDDTAVENDQEEPEVEYGEAFSVARKRRATGSSSSSSNDTSTSSGSSSSGSGSNGSGSSGSQIPSGADIRSVSAALVVIATVIMSAL